MHSKRILGLHPTSVLATLAGLGFIMMGACSAPGPVTDGNPAGSGGTGPSGSGGGGSGDDIADDFADDFVDGINPDGGGGGVTNAATFPAGPIFGDATITADQVTAFADPAAGAMSGVCVHEPHLSDANGPGALFPKNWLRPRFRWTGSGSETLWEVRLSAASQNNDLVVYTKTPSWVMPKELWDNVGNGVPDAITVTIRGLAGGAIVSGAKGDFRVTQALAGGSMVFWGTSSSVPGVGTSALYGFTVGNEAVVPALAEAQVTGVDRVFTATGSDLRGDKSSDSVTGIEPGKAQCIGCHNATPDGKAMIFTDNYPWNIGIASVEAATTGAPPTYVSAGARKFLKMPFLGTGMMLPGDTANTTLITTMGRNRNTSTTASSNIYINYGYNDPPSYEPNLHDLIWIALDNATAGPTDTLPAATAEGTTGAPPWAVDYTGPERAEAALDRDDEIAAGKGTAWGVIASEAGSISNPTPAKTSMKIAYTVSESSYDGHPDWHSNTADIKTADLTTPRAAVTGVPLPGASDPSFLEYYPAFSPDDKLIAFTRAAAPTNTSRCAEGKPIVRTDQAGAKCANPPAAQLGANPDGPYYNRNGEIFVIPSTGGTAVRLRANDPVACGGEVSPGVLNSWPKWSSVVRDVDGKDFYFVIFSSARAYPGQFELTPTEYTPPISKKSSQLYMSTIEVDRATGAVTTYAAIYLWNQNYLALSDTEFTELKTANLTPAWEDFTIPEVPDVIIFK